MDERERASEATFALNYSSIFIGRIGRCFIRMKDSLHTQKNGANTCFQRARAPGARALQISPVDRFMEIPRSGIRNDARARARARERVRINAPTRSRSHSYSRIRVRAMTEEDINHCSWCGDGGGAAPTANGIRVPCAIMRCCRHRRLGAILPLPSRQTFCAAVNDILPYSQNFILSNSDRKTYENSCHHYGNHRDN